jgi:hypothetical protein
MGQRVARLTERNAKVSEIRVEKSAIDQRSAPGSQLRSSIGFDTGTEDDSVSEQFFEDFSDNDLRRYSVPVVSHRSK